MYRRISDLALLSPEAVLGSAERRLQKEKAIREKDAVALRNILEQEKAELDTLLTSYES